MVTEADLKAYTDLVSKGFDPDLAFVWGRYAILCRDVPLSTLRDIGRKYGQQHWYAPGSNEDRRLEGSRQWANVWAFRKTGWIRDDYTKVGRNARSAIWQSALRSGLPGVNKGFPGPTSNSGIGWKEVPYREACYVFAERPSGAHCAEVRLRDRPVGMHDVTQSPGVAISPLGPQLISPMDILQLHLI